jgi:hypothetical protein
MPMNNPESECSEETYHEESARLNNRGDRARGHVASRGAQCR